MKNLAACLLVKNESNYIDEWMCFHAAVGFDSFIVYDNGSMDGTLCMIDRLARFFDVRLVEYPGDRVQLDAYMDCVGRFAGEFERIAFIDIDEFMVPVAADSVPEVIAEFENSPAIVVNWLNYGSAGYKKTPFGLVIENYLYRGERDLEMNRQVKSIVRPREVSMCYSAHSFRYFRGGYPVDENGAELRPREANSWGNKTERVSVDKIRINHYSVKSREDFDRKVEKGRKAYPGRYRFPGPYFSRHDTNEHADTIALRFAEKTKSLMATVDGERIISWR